MLVPRDRIFDVPAWMVEDELIHINAQAAAEDTTKPTQDLMAADMRGSPTSLSEQLEALARG